MFLSYKIYHWATNKFMIWILSRHVSIATFVWIDIVPPSFKVEDSTITGCHKFIFNHLVIQGCSGYQLTKLTVFKVSQNRKKRYSKKLKPPVVCLTYIVSYWFVKVIFQDFMCVWGGGWSAENFGFWLFCIDFVANW